MAFWRAIIPADVGGIPEVSVDVKTLELWMMQEKRKKITGIHEYLPGSVQCGLAWFNAAGSGGRFSREKPRALGRLAMSRLSSVSSGLCDFADVSKKKVNSIIRERAHVHVRLHLQNTRQSCVSRFTLETRNGNWRRWRIRPSCNSKRPASCCTSFKPKTPKKRTVNTEKLDDSRTLLPCGGWRATDQANQAALGHNQETYWTIPTVPNTAASQLTSRPAKSTPHGTHVHRVATNLLLFFSEAALFSIQIEFIKKDVRIRVAFSLHIFHSTFEWTFVKPFQSSWCAAMKCSSFHRLECSPFRAFSDFLRIFKAGAV